MNSAEIILAQLGGSRRLGAMIGAKRFTSASGGRELSFEFCGSQKAKWVRITHNDRDLYDVKFLARPKRADADGLRLPVQVAEFTDIGCDQLMNTFESFTSLYLTLGSRQ